MTPIEFTVHGLLNSFFRQLWVFLLVMILCLAAGFYYIATTPVSYETRGSFVVKFGQNARPDVSMVDNARPREYSYGDRSELMQSYSQILQSRDLLRRVVKEIGVENIYPDMLPKDPEETTSDPVETAMMTLLGRDLKIEPGLRSNVIEVFVKNEDPEKAANVAKTLMELFIPEQSRIFDSSQKDFLDGQILNIQKRLKKAQEELLEFKKAAGISEIDAEMESLLSEKSSLSAIAFEALTEAQANLSEAEAQAATARSTYRANSPVMERMQQKVAVARAELHRRQADLAESETATGPLAQKLKNIDERIAHLEAQRGEYNELAQKVEMESNNLDYYKKRAEEARVNAMLNEENITRISILDEPVTPTSPSGPKKKLILIAALLAGLFLGLMAALIREFLDERFSTPDQVKAVLDLPVLVSFSKARGA